MTGMSRSTHDNGSAIPQGPVHGDRTHSSVTISLMTNDFESPPNLSDISEKYVGLAAPANHGRSGRGPDAGSR